MSGVAAHCTAAVFSSPSTVRRPAASSVPFPLGVSLPMAKRQLLVAAARGYTSFEALAPRLDDLPDVLLVDHVASLFCCSTATVSRRVADGTFPVAPLPAVDRKLRWSRAQLRRWLETGDAFGPLPARRGPTGRRR